MGTKYSSEYKAEALHMASRDGVASASEKLGISPRQIYDWRRAERLKAVRVPKGLQAGETIEEGYNRLEKRCDELAEANYILKKALGFFAGQ